MFKIYDDVQILKRVFLKIDDNYLSYGRMLQDRDYYEPQLKAFNGDIGTFSVIGVDLFLEDRVHIAPGVKMVGKGSVYIGEGSSIAPGVVLYTSAPDHGKAQNSYLEEHSPQVSEIQIGKNCFIGANSTVGFGVEIKDNSVVPPLTFVRPRKVYAQYTRRYDG